MRSVIAVPGRSYRAAALVAALLVTLGCGTVETAQETSPPVVDVAPVIQRDTRQYMEWAATIDGYFTAEVRPHVEGALRRQAYGEGYFVKQGDVLFEIDRREFPEAHDQAGEQARTKIVSPIDGVVGAPRAKPGDLVNASTVLTTVSAVDWIKVFFYVRRQEYLSWTRRTDPAERRVSARPGTMAIFELILPDGAPYAYRGDLIRSHRPSDATTGTVIVTAAFPNPDRLLRPGQRGRVRGAVDVSERTLMVPHRAVFEQDGLAHVAVVGPDSAIDIRIVRTGERVGHLQVIEDGLAPADRVVVAGFENVEPGVVVRTRPAPTETVTLTEWVGGGD
jgi:multidrug efflux pump subunit AcrA (membrane-fusion protein)